MTEDRSLGHHPIHVSSSQTRDDNRDVDVGARVEVTIGLILLTAASILVLIGLFPRLEVRVYANQASAVPANIDVRKLPPEPRLQKNAVQDLEQMRAAEDRMLNSYGWVDQKKGVVRIPIERAVYLLAQRGLPVRGAHAMLNKPGGVGAPAEAGLGSKVH